MVQRKDALGINKLQKLRIPIELLKNDGIRVILYLKKTRTAQFIAVAYVATTELSTKPLAVNAEM